MRFESIKSNNKLLEGEELNDFSENQEYLDKVIEGYIKYSIVNSAEMINEGNCGVISTIDLKSLPLEMVKFFYGDNYSPEEAAGGKFAMKTLKIYSPDAGEKEARMHRRASQIISESGKSEQLAKIPRLYYNKQLNIGSDETELKKKLENDGIDTSAGKFDVMIMDYIDGDDFSSYILKQTIARLSDQELFNDEDLIEMRESLKSKKEFERLNFNLLYDTVSDVLNFETEDQKVYQLKTQAEKDNHLKLIKFLEKKGFRLDSEKFTELVETIRLLNKNNFYHRDLHARNIMVDYDKSGNINKYYLLDFGTSIDTAEDNSCEAYISGDFKYESDNLVTGLYSALAQDKPKEAAFTSELSRLGSKILSDTRISEDLNKLRAAENLRDLTSAINRMSLIHTTCPARCLLILEAAKNNPELARSYLDSYMKKVSLSDRNMLAKLKPLI